MDSGYPPHHHHMQYPNQQQMWANFYSSGPPPAADDGRYPLNGPPMSPHMVGTPGGMDAGGGGGWWGHPHQPPDMVHPYRMGSPGVIPPGAPGPWAMRGPRPRGERRGPGRPRLTAKGERGGSRSRNPSASSPFPSPFPGADGLPPELMGAVPPPGDMKRGPGRPKAILDPNAPKGMPGGPGSETTKNGNKKRYTCEVCQKRFSTAWYVRVHRRSHNGERPYVCNNCGKGFMLPNVLQVHLRKCEKNNPPQGGGGSVVGGGVGAGVVGASGPPMAPSPQQSPGGVSPGSGTGPAPSGGFSGFVADSGGQQQSSFPGMGAFNQRYLAGGGGLTSPGGTPLSSYSSNPGMVGTEGPAGYHHLHHLPLHHQHHHQQHHHQGGGWGPELDGSSGRSPPPQQQQYSPIYSPSNNSQPPSESELHFLANDKPRDKGGTAGLAVPPPPPSAEPLRQPPPGVDPALYCTACDVVFADRQSTEEHTKTHRPFVCDICEKRFSQKCNLVTHIRLHTGEKPYNCEFCDKRFTQKGNLDAHLKTHTKERPFPCSLCPKRFTLKASLQSHLRHHQSGLLTDEGEGEGTGTTTAATTAAMMMMMEDMVGGGEEEEDSLELMKIRAKIQQQSHTLGDSLMDGQGQFDHPFNNSGGGHPLNGGGRSGCYMGGGGMMTNGVSGSAEEEEDEEDSNREDTASSSASMSPPPSRPAAAAALLQARLSGPANPDNNIDISKMADARQTLALLQ
jgi:hypothetical protein